MADNLTTQTAALASIPTSTVIATDDAGAGGHVQLVKLAISTDGSATALTADNTNGLLVNLGTNNDVTVTGTVTVDGSGVTQPVSGTVTANLSATDNAVLDQLEVNTSYGDNTGGGVELGALRVTIANDSTGLVSVDDNGGSLTVDNAALAVTGSGTETGALRVTVATDSTGVLSVDDNGGSLTVDNAALSVTGGGTEATALRVTIANDSTGVVSVDDGGGSLTVDGTVAVSGTVTVDLGANNDVVAAGDVAHDAADSGNPIKIGYKAYNMDGTVPGTAVAEADRANGISDVYGRQFVETAHPNLWQAMGLYSAAQTDASVKAAPGAGLSLYITDIVVSTAGAVNVFFEQGTTKVYGTLYLAANGGASSHFRTPIKLPANTALTFTSSAAVNHSVTVNGYTAP